MQYPLKFLCDLNRNEKILKFIQKYKKIQIDKQLLRIMKNSEGITMLD